MATGCGDVLSLEDLQIAKKHQLFEAEVITGKTGGIAAGVDIDYATNGNTGQVQKTMPAILRDIGFTPASFDFLTGGTIAANQRDLAVLWPMPGGDGDWYYWEGSLPKVIPASSTPATTGGIANGAWRPVGDITLRGQLASSDEGLGDSLVETKKIYNNSISRSQHSLNSEYISVKDFGAKGDGVTDDTIAIQNACSAINTEILSGGTKVTLSFPDGDYLISASLTCYDGMAINCTSRVTFRSVGDSKSFPAWVIYGGGRDVKLGSLSYFSAAFVNLRNTNRITFNAISFCTDAFILRADGVSNLDNEVRGIQVANCDNAGIVFEQNADSLIQQGNDIRVNFVSETPNMVQFRNFGGFTHTKQSNWDSNNIEVQAFDPLSLANSSMVRNSTAYPVPNLKLTVKTWLGGWVPDAGTICLIRGPFSAATYEVSIAGRIGLNELVDSTGKASFGSCVFKNTRQANLGSATAFYAGVNPGTVFNGGESLVLRKFRIRVTVPDLAAGAVFSSSFNHVLSQVAETGRARMVQTPSSARGRYRIEFADAGTESQGMVRIWISNYTAATQTGRDVDIVFEIE